MGLENRYERCMRILTLDWVVGLLRNGYRNDGPVCMVSMHVDR